MSILTNSQSTK